MSGGATLDVNIAQYILTALQTKPRPTSDSITLTEREMQVLELLGEGLQKKEISERLQISTATVATHVRHIYEKLGVQNAPAAISKAFQSGILPKKS